MVLALGHKHHWERAHSRAAWTVNIGDHHGGCRLSLPSQGVKRGRMKPSIWLRERLWATLRSGWKAVEVLRLEILLVGGVLMSAVIDST